MKDGDEECIRFHGELIHNPQLQVGGEMWIGITKVKTQCTIKNFPNN